MADVNIVLDEDGAPENPVQKKDEITWTNRTGNTITEFQLPSCVRPKESPAPIANGATTDPFKVKDSTKKGVYEYSWTEDDPKAGPRNGTIDVN